MNENKNKIDISEEKLKELGVLKVLNVVIEEGAKEPLYCVVTEAGEKEFMRIKL